MFDYATEAVDGAVAAGARYADARVVVSKTESISVQNEALQSLGRAESAGLGVRALIGSSWGFFATPHVTSAAAGAAGARAASIAKASASVPGPTMDFADVGAAVASYETPHVEDPFAVPFSEKVDLLVAVTGTMREVAAITLARGSLGFWDTDKWFVSS